jgi:hypothetical protein
MTWICWVLVGVFFTGLIVRFCQVTGERDGQMHAKICRDYEDKSKPTPLEKYNADKHQK